MANENQEPGPKVTPTAQQVRGTGIRYLVMGGAIAAVGIFAGFLWYSYNQSAATKDGGAPPLIKADTGPTKVKPETPGGMEVPHQDKTVYNRMDAGAKESEPEHLLPIPEQPLPKPRQPDIGALRDLFDNKAPAIPGLEGEQPIIVDLLPSDSGKPKSAAAIPKPGAAQIPVTTPDPKSGKFMIQVGAFRDRASANAGWARMRKRNPELLAALEPSILRADLGAKGVFYRLRAGPLGNKSSADSLCGRLKERKLGCLVVKP